MMEHNTNDVTSLNMPFALTTALNMKNVTP